MIKKGPQSVYHAAEVKTKDLPILNDFINSIAADVGRVTQANFIKKYSDMCPETSEYYLIGYSQGAIFARQFARDLRVADLDNEKKFRGLMLIADPLFHGEEDLCCYFSTMGKDHIKKDKNNKSGANGIGHVKLRSIWAGFTSNSLHKALNLPELEWFETDFGDAALGDAAVVTICSKTDIVCDVSRRWVKGRTVHSESYKYSSDSISYFNWLEYRAKFFLELSGSSGDDRKNIKSVYSGNGGW